MADARRGDCVQIHRVVLEAGKRAPQVPVETMRVPLEMKAKGFLQEEQAMIGQQVTITTLAGRQLQGELIAVNPGYQVDYGSPQPEMLTIAGELRAIVRGEYHA